MSNESEYWIFKSYLDEVKFDEWVMRGKKREILLPIEGIRLVIKLLYPLWENIPAHERHYYVLNVEEFNNEYRTNYKKGDGVFYYKKDDNYVIFFSNEDDLISLGTIIHEFIHKCHYNEKGYEKYKNDNGDDEEKDTELKTAKVMRAFRRLFNTLKDRLDGSDEFVSNNFPIPYLALL